MEKAPPSLMGFWCFNSSSTSRDMIKTVSVILGAYKSVSEGDAAKWNNRKIFDNKDISPSVLRFKTPVSNLLSSGKQALWSCLTPTLTLSAKTLIL